VKPRLIDSILSEQYNAPSYRYLIKNLLMKTIDYRKNVVGFRKFKEVSKYFDFPGSVLDIGCGLGEVLANFKENNWKCKGIELNKEAYDYCRKKWKIDVINTPIEDWKTEEKFDAIMMWGVLEHLTNPVEVLKKADALLKRGGMIFIEVPYADSFLINYYRDNDYLKIDRIVDGDKHLMLFSKKSIEFILSKIGTNYRIEEIKTLGLDFVSIIRYENENVSNRFCSKVQALIDKSFLGDSLRVYMRKC
jgi:2-polyprenyl-3-methyl-5-hydroxy-6-metoxy-1,4-benzoquinol methylase